MKLVLDLQDLFVAVIEARKKCLVLALTATRRIEHEKARRFEHHGLSEQRLDKEQT